MIDIPQSWEIPFQYQDYFGRIPNWILNHKHYFQIVSILQMCLIIPPF